MANLFSRNSAAYSRRLLFTLFLSAAATLTAGPNVFADNISIRGDEWCPFNCVPGSKKPGYVIEIAKIIFEEAGHTVDYQTLNWARAIADTRSGVYTAIVGANVSDAPDFVFPRVEQGQSKMCFYVSKTSSWTYSGIDSLKSIKLGIAKDYAYFDELDEYIAKNPTLVNTLAGDDTLDKNIKMVTLGRIGAFIDDEAVVESFIADSPNKGEIKQAGCSEADPIYIAFSPANPKAKEFAELLSSGIEKLRSSGKLKDILSNYGLEDWK